MSKAEESNNRQNEGQNNSFFGIPLGNNIHAERMKQSIGNFLPTAALANLTTKKYTLPDKNVASQVLMYRQLLHTACKPGLRLSRAYQGTSAQKAVKHMPWWEQGVETSKKMVISYDNLIVRLWLNGAIMPFAEGGYASDHKHIDTPKDSIINEAIETGDLLSLENPSNNQEQSSTEEQSTNLTDKDDTNTDDEEQHVDTLINEKGLPPIPHDYWVDRLGFQQTDPVTDFRSGGVLSLAMLVHIVESCAHIHAHFLPTGDVHMLPFGITCINITDMIAKFCMFSKSVDKMDALLSQKPFWRMFGDPNALLALQELSMEILCGVVVELGRERKIPGSDVQSSLHGEHEGKVTVFDFSEILRRTENRVRDDLLGAGPKTVDELRSIAARLRQKYEREILKKEEWGHRRKKKSDPQHDLKQNVAKISGNIKHMTGSVVGGATNIMNKMNSHYVHNPPSTTTKLEKKIKNTEEIDFALPPNNKNTASTKETENNPSNSSSSQAKIIKQSGIDSDVVKKNSDNNSVQNKKSENNAVYSTDDEIDLL